MDSRANLSLGDLFSELQGEISRLVSLEVKLAKTELTEKVSGLGKGAALVGAGGIVAFVGFQALTFAVIAALWIWLPLWAAALIVAVVWMVAGYLALRSGISSINEANLGNWRTADTLKEIGDAQYVREQRAA